MVPPQRRKVGCLRFAESLEARAAKLVALDPAVAGALLHDPPAGPRDEAALAITTIDAARRAAAVQAIVSATLRDALRGNRRPRGHCWNTDGADQGRCAEHRQPLEDRAPVG